ncbi:MAG: hypothetical protein ACKOW2_03590 [Sphingobacteriaceae bacterium]
MKNIRFTPLNIISALLLISVAYLFIFADSTGWRTLGALPLIGLLILLVLSDLLFRFKLTSLKQIWIVEGLFLIFVVLVIFIINK